MSRHGSDSGWPRRSCRSGCWKSCADAPDRRVRVHPLGPLQPVFGWALGPWSRPRGANVHAVLLDADGRVATFIACAPLVVFPNWPLVPLAVPGNLMPDFPLINKSLVAACLDR